MILVKIVIFKSMLGPLFLDRIPYRVHESVASSIMFIVIYLKGGARLRVLVSCPLTYCLAESCVPVCANGLPDGDG